MLNSKVDANSFNFFTNDLFDRIENSAQEGQFDDINYLTSLVLNENLLSSLLQHSNKFVPKILDAVFTYGDPERLSPERLKMHKMVFQHDVFKHLSRDTVITCKDGNLEVSSTLFKMTTEKLAHLCTVPEITLEMYQLKTLQLVNMILSQDIDDPSSHLGIIKGASLHILMELHDFSREFGLETLQNTLENVLSDCDTLVHYLKDPKDLPIYLEKFPVLDERNYKKIVLCYFKNNGIKILNNSLIEAKYAHVLLDSIEDDEDVKFCKEFVRRYITGIYVRSAQDYAVLLTASIWPKSLREAVQVIRFASPEVPSDCAQLELQMIFPNLQGVELRDIDSVEGIRDIHNKLVTLESAGKNVNLKALGKTFKIKKMWGSIEKRMKFINNPPISFFEEEILITFDEKAEYSSSYDDDYHWSWVELRNRYPSELIEKYAEIYRGDYDVTVEFPPSSKESEIIYPTITLTRKS
jgi:hypothetical protein